MTSSQSDNAGASSDVVAAHNGVMNRDQPNTFASSHFNMSRQDNQYTTVDASVNMSHLFPDSSTTLVPDATSLDCSSSSRSINDMIPRQSNSLNGSSTSNLSQPPLTHGSLQTSLESAAFMVTADQSMDEPGMSNAMFCDDLGFLEDILLPEYVFNVTGFNTPIPWDLERSDIQPFSSGRRSDISQSALFLPKLPPTTERFTDRQNEIRSPYIFDISVADVAQFQKNIVTSDLKHRLQDFSFPRRSRILRCLSAYFDNVDPHVPIVQHATFSLCGAPPALVLAMLALGATITSEHRFATSAYTAACTLLGYRTESDGLVQTAFEFWPIQSLLLCVQFGSFSDNEVYAQRSQTQINLVSKMLGRGLDKLNTTRIAPQQDWATWSFVETFSRLASWTCLLSGILLAYDPSYHITAPHHLRHVPLALDEDLWRARSAQEWSSLGGRPHQHNSPDFLTLAESLFKGEPVLDKISCFGLLTLIGWMLLYICNHERVTISVGSLDMFEVEFTNRIEKGLEAWENLTRRHLRTGQVMFRQLNPLISDSFPLLGSAYYHLHLGEELRALKEAALDHDNSAAMSLPEFQSRPLVYKAIRYAANSWLVRAKLGISHFQQSPDVYGSHGPMSAYEAGKSLPQPFPIWNVEISSHLPSHFPIV